MDFGNNLETRLANQGDVRILNLKRWNLPQTKQLQTLNDANEQPPGMYVSSQSYHFIDIESAGCDETIYSTYKKSIEKIRKPANHPQKSDKLTLNNDIHTIQSITLLGQDTGFWDNAGTHLNITFIQLTNSDRWDLDKLKQEVQRIMANYKSIDGVSPVEWTVYYSLDFCDLILFTKNITIKDYYAILWKLSLFRESDCPQIRDTFSLFCFEYQYLKKAFELIKNNKAPIWNDTADIQIRLSLQSVSALNELLEALKPYKDKSDVYMLPGRNDVCIRMKNMNGSDILIVLYHLDHLAAQKQANEVFASYDLTLLSEIKPPLDNGLPAPKNHNLAEAAASLLDPLGREYCTNMHLHAKYAEETRKSLISLLKKGFSDEFVVSVLLSFIAYLNICLTITEDDLRNHKIQNSFNDMKHRYFGAINTLSLCTMHTERQFIQAPSYNATYFDIPPKLLAFYTAITFTISNNLLMPNEAPYRFVIVPDFRKDINVIPLTISKKINTNEHLAIIYLAESYFYDPITAIQLLSHEIAHYVGERKREDRASYLFKSISLINLSRTKLVEFINNNTPSIPENSIIHILANSLSQYMKEKFDSKRDANGVIEYSMEKVTEFLENDLWGYDYFFDSIQRSTLKEHWKQALKQKIQDSSVKEEFILMLNKMQGSLNTDYYTKHLDSEETLDYFSRNCLQYVREAYETLYLHKKKTREYYQLIQSTIQAYSESLPDLRMIEICGQFDKSSYENLLLTISEQYNTQRALRHDAVCLLLDPSFNYSGSAVRSFLNNAEAEKIKPEQPAILNTIARHIKEYLEVCKSSSPPIDIVKNVLETFRTKSTTEQFKLIHNVIHDYRNQLCFICKKEYEKQAENQSAACDVCLSCEKKCELASPTTIPESDFAIRETDDTQHHT